MPTFSPYFIAHENRSEENNHVTVHVDTDINNEPFPENPASISSPIIRNNFHSDVTTTTREDIETSFVSAVTAKKILNRNNTESVINQFSLLSTVKDKNKITQGAQNNIQNGLGEKKIEILTVDPYIEQDKSDNEERSYSDFSVGSAMEQEIGEDDLDKSVTSEEKVVGGAYSDEKLIQNAQEQDRDGSSNALQKFTALKNNDNNRIKHDLTNSADKIGFSESDANAIDDSDDPLDEAEIDALFAEDEESTTKSEKNASAATLSKSNTDQNGMLTSNETLPIVSLTNVHSQPEIKEKESDGTKKKRRKRDKKWKSNSFVSLISKSTEPIEETKSKTKRRKKNKKKLSINVDSFLGLEAPNLLQTSHTEQSVPKSENEPLHGTPVTMNDTSIIEGAISASLPEDKLFLSSLNCLVRKNLEFFSTTYEDIARGNSGRRTVLVYGKVGLRCVHCYKAARNATVVNPIFPTHQLTKNGTVDKRRSNGLYVSGSISYPTNIAAIYTQISQKPNLHFAKCPNLPLDVREQFNSLMYDQNGKPLRQKQPNPSIAIAHHVDSARRIGLIDSPIGIKFGRDLKNNPLPLGRNLATLVNGNNEGLSSTSFSALPTSLTFPNSRNTLLMKFPKREALTDVMLEKILADTSGDDPRAILPEDRNSVSDFVYALLKQLKFTHADSRDNIKTHRNRSMRIGYSGFCCRHCSVRYENNTFPLPSGGRFFSSAADNLCAAITNAFFSHLQKCIDVPKEIVQALMTLKKLHSRQMENLPTGSQRRLFHTLWTRMRKCDTFPNDKDSSTVDELLLGRKNATLPPTQSMMTTRSDHKNRNQSPDKLTVEKIETFPSMKPPGDNTRTQPPQINVGAIQSPKALAKFSPPTRKIFDSLSYYENDPLTRKVISELLASKPLSFGSAFAPMVFSHHRSLITDYIFLILLQLNICNVDVNDFHRGKRSKTLQIGLAGLCCKHCLILHAPNQGRSFPTTPDNIVSGTNVSYYNHAMKCASIPPDIKHCLEATKKTHSAQMSLLPHGSQRMFFQQIFKILRQADKIKAGGPHINQRWHNGNGFQNGEKKKALIEVDNSWIPPNKGMPTLNGTIQDPSTSPSTTEVSQTSSFQPLKEERTIKPISNNASIKSSRHDPRAVPNQNTILQATPDSVSHPLDSIHVNSTLTSRDKLKRYAFIQTSTDWWVCKHCRMVPLDLRSRGSLYSSIPTEKDIRMHRFICRENSFELQPVLKVMRDMVDHIEGMTIELLEHPLFKCIVRELVGGNQRLCDLFTSKLKSKLENNCLQIETRGMWSLFPNQINNEAVFHALSTFRNAKTGVSQEFVTNEYFCKFVCFLAPFAYDRDVLESMDKRLKETASMDVDDFSMLV